MRDAFVRALMALAEKRDDITLITGDLGFGVLTPFKERFPNKYINAGIAEQAMTGFAAGMALSGRTVFTYSIGNFPTLRALEQIRNDCAYHDANVKVVCVGGGFVYGALGMSHHATEDVTVLRALPNVTVFSPGDPYEVEAIMPSVCDLPGTCYLRLGRGNEPRAHAGPVAYRHGCAIPLYEGTDGYVFTSGGILTEAKTAVDALRAEGLSIGLYSFPCVKPLDAETIARIAKKAPFIVTVEEHNIIGGFGGAVCEVAAELRGSRAFVRRMGINDCYSAVVGSQSYLRDHYGFSAAHIAEAVRALAVTEASSGK